MANTHKASADTYLHEIPLYENLKGDDKAHIDIIIADNEVTNPEQASMYGDHIMEQTLAVSNQIIQAMQSEEHGVMREPLQACVDDLREIDLESLQGSVGAIVDKGADYAGRGIKYARKNPGTTAIIAAGAITGQFWASAAAGGVTGVRQYVAKKKKEKSGVIDMDKIEDQIKSALTITTKHMQDLKMAELRVPVLMERITALGDTNGKTYKALTEYICAGREILRRLNDDGLSAAAQEAEENPGFDNSKRLRQAQETIEVLNHKLIVMETARQDSVLETVHLADMSTAIRTNHMSVRSLLTSEVPTMQRTIATAGLALDTHNTTKLTEQFRDHVDRTKDAAATASQQASEAARAGRADSPERLQIAIDRTVKLQKRLEGQAQIAQEMDEDITRKRAELELKTAELVVTANKDLTDTTALPSPEAPNKIAIDAPRP